MHTYTESGMHMNDGRVINYASIICICMLCVPLERLMAGSFSHRLRICFAPCRHTHNTTNKDLLRPKHDNCKVARVVCVFQKQQ